jgi:very-short-patch-repair endonuclease
MLKGTGKAYRRAKALRREMTLPEILLWQHLRRRQTGQHWRKQHPAGPYDLDFYCDKAKLCVEVDGEAHSRGGRPARDERRDKWLAENGIFTLRIAAVDALKNLEGVLIYINETTRERVAQLENSSPHGGGGERGETEGP